MLEQRCIKFIWTLLRSPNIIVKYVMRSAIRNGYSTLGENCQFHHMRPETLVHFYISFSEHYGLQRTLRMPYHFYRVSLPVDSSYPVDPRGSTLFLLASSQNNVT